jgi:hypothetical protein
MSKIRVQNFGPIKAGLIENDHFIDIRKVTIFIGNQGTGKNSIAKLISTLSWLEKALYRGDLEVQYVIKYNRFVKSFCQYQNLTNYFLTETKIEYTGDIYRIIFENQKLLIEPTDNANYRVPKIMYVPAERNFLSAVRWPEKLKGLPDSLYTFWEELDRSQQELSGSLPLPVGEVTLEFDKLNKIAKIVGSDYKLNLSEASSGFQSFVPLFLVSRNIALSIARSQENSPNELSGEEKKRLKTEIERILSNDNLSDDLKKAALEVLSSKYRNECFINIVEEIEQNLFPTSQKNILYQLFEFANLTQGNKLILTTHSPYIINDLILAIKADKVNQKILSSSISNADSLQQKLNTIVPKASYIAAEDAIVYELTEQGEIRELATYEGLPSDENYLNLSLAETNQLFDDLLAIEEQL